MALIQSTAIPSGATDYELEQSLKFEDTAKNGTGSYLNRTPSSAGNSDLWTYSCWAKGLPAPNSNSHETQILLSVSGVDTNDYLWLSISNDGTLDFRQWDDSSGYFWRKISTALYRDPSSWYHYVVTYDSANSTAEDRIKMYVNGERITSFGTNANPSSGQDSFVNKTKLHAIGRFSINGVVQTDGALNGYLAEVNLIDGQALTPTSFGETGDYNEWKPIEYSGTYGTNGFYLSFEGGGIMSATGGNSTATDGDYKAASFTSNGTFTPSVDGYVEYLVIGGGGAGGGGNSSEQANGGGGAGAFRTGYLAVTGGTGYSITVGAGGSGSQGETGGSGNSSVFSTITAVGGGGGGKQSTNGVAGGSGGGGGYNASGGSGTSGQGNSGGSGSSASGGGGGGASAAGANASGDTAGNGGAGLASSITGSSVTYAGGGGGGTYGTTTSDQGTAGSGGSGGGGAGKLGRKDTIRHGDDGTANTGGGGGGAAAGTGITRGSGGYGGSGIVIIRYKFQ